MDQTLTFPAPVAAPHGAPRRRVKDAPTRLAHWSMAVAFVVAYVSAESESWRLWHVIAGYCMVLALAFRVFWGLVGPQSLRPSLWWQRTRGALQWGKGQFRPEALARWASQTMAQAKQALMQGNALFMAALLLAMPLLALSGYVLYNDIAPDWVEEVHEWLSNAALFAVLAHVGVLLAGSFLRRSNLMAPMCSGTVAGKGPDVVAHNRLWVALSMAALLIAFALWYAVWQ